jgi:hypothetical protein
VRIRRGLPLLASIVVALAAAAAPAGAASPADWLYEPTTFTEIDLTLPPASIATLEEEPEDHYVQGFFSIAETDGVPGSAGAFTAPVEVGVRLKGSVGSFEDLDHKAGFKIKFDEFVDGQTFDGLEKMTLNNMVQDPSMVHETLAYEAFRALGVPAPHTGFTYLRVNGQSFGLHLNVETLDKVALEKQLGPFLNPPQHLYEGESGADVTPAKWELLEVDEGKKKEKGDLKALVDAVALVSPSFSQRVTGLADLDEMTRMWAVEKYIGHWDGYSGAFVPDSELPNNYYLYSDASGQFQMLPWGTDQTWSDILQFESDGGALFNDCKAETGTGSCQSLYRAALGKALTALVALDPDQIARCGAESLRPWQQFEATQSAPQRRPFSQKEIDDDVFATREFIDERPGELASFLSTSAPAPPADTPCPPLRRAVNRAVTPVASSQQGQPPPPSAPISVSLGSVEAHRRLLRVHVTVSAPGPVALKGEIETKAGLVKGCSGHKSAEAAETLELACQYTAGARQRLTVRWLRMALTATVTGAAGTDSASRAIKLRRLSPVAPRQP